MWAMVQDLDFSPLYAQIKAVEGHAGRSATDPQILAALGVYAILGRGYQRPVSCGDGVMIVTPINGYVAVSMSIITHYPIFVFNTPNG